MKKHLPTWSNSHRQDFHKKQTNKQTNNESTEAIVIGKMFFNNSYPISLPRLSVLIMAGYLIFMQKHDVFVPFVHNEIQT